MISDISLQSEEAEPNTRDAGISPQSEMGRLRKVHRTHQLRSRLRYSQRCSQPDGILGNQRTSIPWFKEIRGKR